MIWEPGAIDIALLAERKRLSDHDEPRSGFGSSSGGLDQVRAGLDQVRSDGFVNPGTPRFRSVGAGCL